jgi:uncharacterized spore protein YtfJ
MNKTVILIVIAVVAIAIGFGVGAAFGKNRAKKDYEKLLGGGDGNEDKE